MAADEAIRVVVKVNPTSHPELYEALKDNGGRAERIRSLALMALSGMATAPDPTPDKPKGRQKKKPAPLPSSGDSAKQDDSIPSAATNDEGETKASKEDPQEDPHKEVRAATLSGLKKMEF